MHRSGVNKARSAKKFNRGASRTHPRNMAVHRGGYRL